MNIKDLIEVIMCEDVEEKGIVKVYIDSLTDEELNLLLENVGEKIKKLEKVLNGNKEV